MRYYSQYPDETFEKAKAACWSGKGFASIEEAIEITKAECADERVPFIVVDDTGSQVWPPRATADDAYELMMEIVQLARSGKDYKNTLLNLKIALKNSPQAADLLRVMIKNLEG